ncbi:MAG: 50S ribosomal protein L25 [Minisyncoccia bacterium]
MTALTLKASLRKIFGKKTESLRKQGFIPAVVYGPKTEPISLQVKEKDFLDIYKKAGETDLINLLIETDGKEIKKQVMIQDVNYHFLYDNKIVHVDFYEVPLDKPITVYAPIHFIGESPAVKKGGVLIKSMDEIMIEALPQDVPHSMEVDISKIEDFGQTLYVKDLLVSEKIKILVDPNTPIVTVSAPLTEEELEKELGEVKGVEEIKTEKEEKEKEEEEKKMEENQENQE